MTVATTEPVPPDVNWYDGQQAWLNYYKAHNEWAKCEIARLLLVIYNTHNMKPICHCSDCQAYRQRGGRG